MYSSLTFKNRDLSGLLGFSMKTNELQNRSGEDGFRVNDCRSEPLWANNIMEFIQDTIFRLINYLEVKGPSIEKRHLCFVEEISPSLALPLMEGPTLTFLSLDMKMTQELGLELDLPQCE